MKKTVSVNIDNIDPEFKPLCKNEMTMDEIGNLGMVVFKHKLSKIKQKILGWFHR